MHPRTTLVHFYFLRVKFLVKASTSGRCDQVWLPWQRNICRSRYGCFCSSPQVTYLHTKIEGGLKLFISNFASLSWRIALKSYDLHYHLYEDDSQIYVFFPSQSQQELCLVKSKLEACVKHIDSWIVSNRLKLNQDKTELLLISSRYRQSLALTYLQVGEKKICPSESVRNLGVRFDQHARMHVHVKKVCRASFYHLKPEHKKN